MASINRREFMGKAAGVMASFSILPRRVLGGPGYQAPSETLNIAGIGVGGMGGVDIRSVESQNIVALCDVDWNRAAETFKRYPKAKKYKDFRVMLEQEKSIDAVVVATPDHCHAVAAMAAIKMGKHVYVEKPMAHSIHEVRTLTEAAREAGVATQMGNHGHAKETMRLLKELDRRRRDRNRAGGTGLDAAPGLAARHFASDRHAARARYAQLGSLARPGPATTLSSRLCAGDLARLVGFRYRRTRRHGLSYFRHDVLRLRPDLPDQRGSQLFPVRSQRHQLGQAIQ